MNILLEYGLIANGMAFLYLILNLVIDKLSPELSMKTNWKIITAFLAVINLMIYFTMYI
jgi:hypothetical protein